MFSETQSGTLSARFVDTYRQIETMIEQRMAGRPRKHTSAIMEYLADAESRPVRADLQVAREIRNIIMHNADETGMPVIEPSQGAADALDRVLEYIKKPPLALTFATPAADILCVRINDLALPLMRAMKKRGFSHAPVMEGDRLVGVFSGQAMFSYITEKPCEIDEKTRVSAFSEYLPLDRHEPEWYLFMDEAATYADVKQAFEDKRRRNSRLSAVFITATGEPDKPLLGMITPWDALGRVSNTSEEK